MSLTAWQVWSRGAFDVSLSYLGLPVSPAGAANGKSIRINFTVGLAIGGSGRMYKLNNNPHGLGLYLWTCITMISIIFFLGGGSVRFGSFFVDPYYLDAYCVGLYDLHPCDPDPYYLFFVV